MRVGGKRDLLLVLNKVENLCFIDAWLTGSRSLSLCVVGRHYEYFIFFIFIMPNNNNLYHCCCCCCGFRIPLLQYLYLGFLL